MPLYRGYLLGQELSGFRGVLEGGKARIGRISYAREVRCNGYALLRKDLERDGAGKAERGCEPAREMAAAPDIVGRSPLRPGTEIGMAWTRNLGDVLVVLGAGIRVPDDAGKRGPAGEAFCIEAGDDLGQVCLLAGRRPGALSRSTSSHELLHGVHVDLDAGRKAGDHAADGFGMGLAEDGDRKRLSHGRWHLGLLPDNPAERGEVLEEGRI